MNLPLLSIPGVRRTLWWFLGAAFLGWALAWWASGRFADGRKIQLVQRQLERAQAEVGLLSADITQSLAQANSVPSLLSQDHFIQLALAAMGPGVQPSALVGEARGAQWLAKPELVAISQRLEQVLQRFGLNTVWVTNAAGDAVAEAHAPGLLPFLGANYADREYFKAAQAGMLGSQFGVSRVTNVYGLYFSAPITVRGQFLGMVGASVRLDTLTRLLGDAELLMTDEHGVVVMAEDPTWRLKALPNAQVFQLTPEQRELRYKQRDFGVVDMVRLPGGGPHTLYQWPAHPTPHVLASRPVMNGALQLHLLREVAADLAHLHGDRWRWFGLTSLAWTFLLAWLTALTAYLAVSRQQKQDLLVLNQELQRQTNTDALTGAASRRHYLESLHLELERAQRYGLSFCVLSLDIDHFKLVNDTHGHAVGDAVLRHFALVVQGLLRQSDVLGRVGGEEFSVLLPQTAAEGGLQMAERIRAAVAASPTECSGQVVTVTVSIGGVQWLANQPTTVDQLMAASDRALYQAKHQGRNQVVWAGGATPSPQPESPPTEPTGEGLCAS